MNLRDKLSTPQRVQDKYLKISSGEILKTDAMQEGGVIFETPLPVPIWGYFYIFYILFNKTHLNWGGTLTHIPELFYISLPH